jgi:Zn-dependent protease
MFGIDTIAVIVFFSLVGLLLFLDRKNIEFNYGLIIRRWKRGQYVMDKWIFSHRRLLEIAGTVGVVVGFLASGVGIFGIAYATFLGERSVAPILPTVENFQYPSGIIGVPFWFWIVSIFVVLSVHETTHAIYSRLAGVPVKSWGIMTFFVLPLGAFVDPDMKKVQKLNLMQKLKIFVGGSFANFLTAGVVMILLTILSLLLFGQVNVPGGPADMAGVEGKILSVNGVEITHPSNLSKILNETKAGTTIQITTDKGTYDVVTSYNNKTGGSYIGMTFGLKPEYAKWSGTISVLMKLLEWLIIFNVGIGIFNMMPMRPFDGGHMFEAVFARIFKSDNLGRKAINLVSLIILVLIVFNVFGTGIIKSLL